MKLNNVNVRVLVVFFFLINVLSIPCLVGKVMAEEPNSAAARAGSEAGGATVAGISTGTIAVGAVVAAVGAALIISSGGQGEAIAPAPQTASQQSASTLATSNPAVAQATDATLQALTSAQISALSTAVQGFTPAAQSTLALDAANPSFSAAQFQTKYPSFAQSLNLTQLTALRTMLGSTVTNGVVNTALLGQVTDTIKNIVGVGLTNQQIAQNQAAAQQVLLQAQYGAGHTIIVTAYHQGNNVWITTVTHTIP